MEYTSGPGAIRCILENNYFLWALLMLILIDGTHIKSSENRSFKGTSGNTLCTFFFSKKL